MFTRRDLKALDSAWVKFHNAHKTMMSKTPGTAGHRKAEEVYGKAEEELEMLKRSYEVSA